MKKHYRLPINNDSFVHLFINGPSTNNFKACVIFSHGFLVPGFESSRMFITLSNELVNRGYKTILFDYRGSGYSDLEFCEMTIDTEIEDLNAVITHVVNHEALNKETIVWGQSFGSGVASLVISTRNDIDRLILWCLSSNLYERYCKTLGADLLDSDYKYLDSGFNVSRQFLLSLKDKDVNKAISLINIPKLFVHGDADEKAPFELSLSAYNISKDPKKIIRIPGGKHAFKGQPDLFEMAKSETINWLEERYRNEAVKNA